MIRKSQAQLGMPPRRTGHRPPPPRLLPSEQRGTPYQLYQGQGSIRRPGKGQILTRDLTARQGNPSKSGAQTTTSFHIRPASVAPWYMKTYETSFTSVLCRRAMRNKPWIICKTCVGICASCDAAAMAALFTSWWGSTEPAMPSEETPLVPQMAEPPDVAPEAASDGAELQEEPVHSVPEAPPVDEPHTEAVEAAAVAAVSTTVGIDPPLPPPRDDKPRHPLVAPLSKSGRSRPSIGSGGTPPASKRASATQRSAESNFSMTRAQFSQVVKMDEKARQASLAREEREERRRFKDRQKEAMRQRSVELRARQQSSQREVRGATKQAAKGQPSVVDLGSLKSLDRAAIQKVLWSPVLCGDKEFTYFATGQEQYVC